MFVSSFAAKPKNQSDNLQRMCFVAVKDAKREFAKLRFMEAKEKYFRIVRFFCY